jgi:hypothetical protein
LAPFWVPISAKVTVQTRRRFRSCVRYWPNDGVHLEPAGNRNILKAIIAAFEKLATGFVLSDPEFGSGSTSGISGVCSRKEKNFFWRGFSSPAGDAASRVRLHGDQPGKGGRLQRAYHPYRRK